jgi:transcriptional regulator with XRE-family HTH domain
MGPNDYGIIVGTIKRTLKARKMTYSELAKLVGMSESGVKKMFAAKDGSLGRVCSICEALGLTLRDVLDMDTRWQSQIMEFTEDQETYLLEDEEALKVFFLIAYDGLSIGETRTKLKLSNARMNQILRKLDKLNIIRWLPYDHANTRRDGIVLWKNKGKFVEFIKEKWSKTLLAEALNDSQSSEHHDHFMLSYLKLTDSSLDDFRQALRRLLEEYRLRCRHEINYYGLKNLKGFRFMAANKVGSFVE